MKLGRILAFATLAFTVSAVIAQTAPAKPHHAPKAPPKPEPTQLELVEYLHGMLLSLSAGDSIHDNQDVEFNQATNTLTVIQPMGRCDNAMGSLNANSISWDTFDPSDRNDVHAELLRVTIASSLGKTARVCTDKNGKPDTTAAANRVRLVFSAPKAEQFPDFQTKMTKALQKLIGLSGGTAEKELF
jgi:hypothetical protein